MSKLKTLSSFALLTSLIAAPAASADWDGLYISAFTGLSLQSDQESTLDLETVSTEFDTGFVLGGSIGYRFEQGTIGSWRTEVEVAYRENDVDAGTFTGLPNANFGGDNSSLSVFGNILYDFTVVPIVTPYVGIGLGFGGVESDTVIDEVTNLTFGGDTQSEFLFQAIGGLSFPIAPNIEGFVDGRYYTAPGVDFSIVDPINNREEAFDSEFEVFQVQAGLRLHF